ncbi:hypothetical protein [Vibrio cyclitrophicus]|uniref:hypothetical protein n=1 Tax=Vibrio cyclitrophicus TaxID=47951 RepID=UPI000C8552FC|nr:hypothetical protein [Vibrio cyclitrophicus]PMG81989.1 hypothetical protein BCU82_06025 [Vibrio cyclitrophicus]
MKIKGKTSHVRCHLLFSIALDAQSRVANEPEQALVSLIFSYSALEAFINESLSVTEQFSGGRRSDDEKKFYALMLQLQEKKDSTEQKYHMSKILFTGSPWQKGDEPFQRFDFLKRLRNELIHKKSETTETVKNLSTQETSVTLSKNTRNLIKGLKERQLIDETTENGSWLDAIQNEKFAKWCCDTAIIMSDAFIDMLPSSKFQEIFKEMLEFQRNG